MGRNPGWTDRILYRGCLQIQLYDSNNLIGLSDHRPVYAQFTVQPPTSKYEVTESGELVNEVGLGQVRTKACTIF